MNFTDVLTMLMAFAFVIFIIWLAYKSSKWLSKRNITLTSKGKYINIIDRVVVGQDKYILIIQTGDKHLLVGIANNGISVLSEINQEELVEIEVAKPNTDFKKILKVINNSIKKPYNRDGGRL